MLAKRHHDLVARRTQAICRLHAMLAMMTAGGLPRLLSAERAASGAAPDPTRPTRSDWHAPATPRRVTRRGPPRRHPNSLHSRTRIVAAVAATDTTVTDIHGVGPVVAAYLIGYTGDVGRFPTKAHYARYNATAPLNASSGPNLAAPPERPGQPSAQPCDPHGCASPRSPTTPPGAPTTSANAPNVIPQGSAARPEATDQRRHLRAGYAPTRTLKNGAREGTQARLLNPAWPAQPLNTGTSEQPLPDPRTRLRPPARAPPRASSTRANTPKREHP